MSRTNDRTTTDDLLGAALADINSPCPSPKARRMIARVLRLMAGEPEPDAAPIVGKFSTGPNCYDLPPRPFPRTMPNPLPPVPKYDAPKYREDRLGKARPYTLSPEGRQARIDNGARRKASNAARNAQNPDMADLAATLYPKGLNQ